MNDSIPTIKAPCNKCGEITTISIFDLCCSLCLKCVAKLDTLEKIKEEVQKDYNKDN